MRQAATFVIASLTFKEAGRRRILLAALALGIVFLAVYGLGIHFIKKDLTRQGEHMQRAIALPMYNFLALSGLYVVNFLTLAMTVLTSVDTISGEIDSGTVHVVAAKPIHRRQILIGKWLGFAIMLSLYLLLMAGGVVALTRLILGYMVPNPLRGLGLLWLNQLLVLNITLLGGTHLSTLANGVLVFAAYGVAFIGGWIEQIGAFLGNETTAVIGIISSLLMPSEALWKRASFEMETALAGAVPPNPFTAVASVPSMAMVIYAMVYAAAALALAAHCFSRRDL
jgi:ABC-type transport system involved in multi-copper enzyme maturation permease subunit